MLSMILEAAFRSLLMAVTVWACVRALRVQAVVAQKVAWVLVLLAAVAMPMVMRSPFFARNRAIEIPLQRLSHALPAGHNKATGETERPSPAWPISAQTKSADAEKPQYGHLSGSAAKSTTAIVGRANHASMPTPQPALIPDWKPAETAALSMFSSPNPAAELAQTITSNFIRIWNWWTAARILAFVYLAYFAVAAVLLLRSLCGLIFALYLWHRAAPATELPFGAAAAAKVRVSPDLPTPVTIASTVILPRDYPHWDEAKLRVVLAHEQSHVRQKDFYLQLFAALYAAIFWFSPLGWWLRRKLTELGEALSDRAGLEEAADPASYAQILLEFAALPRSPYLRNPISGVAMARNSNLSSRIDRILNSSSFRQTFLGGRRHAVLAAILVPAALVVTVAGIRIVPRAEAATMSVGPATRFTAGARSELASAALPVLRPVLRFVQPQSAPSAAPAIPAVAPAPPAMEAPEAPNLAEAPKAPDAPEVIVDHEDDSVAIVTADGKRTIHVNSRYNARDIDKVRSQVHSDSIIFERDGKSYYITDPAIVAQARALFKEDPALTGRQAQLQHLQADLDIKMEKLKPEIETAAKPSPEFEAQMKQLSRELAELQSQKFKQLTDQISKDKSQEKLAELQEKMGDIQGQIGEIQGQIGERVGKIGDRQGELGEQMGKLGEEMGKIGEEQGRKAEEASRKLQSLIDRAVKDGKAQPVK